MILRPKRVPENLAPAFAAFSDQVDRLEEARRAMLSCLPVGRVEPAPIAVGLDLLDDTLEALGRELPAWRDPAVESVWQACVDAIEESRAKIPRAHEVAAQTGELEELLGALEDVDEPLGHAFGQAERAFRALRRR